LLTGVRQLAAFARHGIDQATKLGRALSGLLMAH
jgi:hypothetical protein